MDANEGNKRLFVTKVPASVPSVSEPPPAYDAYDAEACRAFASAPAETRVLQTDADGAADSCALRFRVQNVGSGAMTADGLARAVGGDVAMDPPTVPPGGLAHARWDRAC